MEHFYNAPHMGEDYFTYAALYEAAVGNFPSGSHFVEIGAYKGRSSSYLAVEIVNSGKNIKLDCIDSWDNEDFKRYWNSQEEGLGDGVYKNFVRNISPVRDRINVIKGNSWETANLYKDNSLDFVFIDADHEYDSVYKDINAWLPKVKKGGLLSGHDYYFDGAYWVGVRDACDQIFGKGNYSDPWGCKCWVKYL